MQQQREEEDLANEMNHKEDIPVFSQFLNPFMGFGGSAEDSTVADSNSIDTILPEKNPNDNSSISDNFIRPSFGESQFQRFFDPVFNTTSQDVNLHCDGIGFLVPSNDATLWPTYSTSSSLGFNNDLLTHSNVAGVVSAVNEYNLQLQLYSWPPVPAVFRPPLALNGSFSGEHVTGQDLAVSQNQRAGLNSYSCPAAENSFHSPHCMNSMPLGFIESAGVANIYISSVPNFTSGVPMSMPPFAPSLGNRIPCTHPTCTKTFKRDANQVRHFNNIHNAILGTNLCPIMGCPRSQGAGYSRADKVTEHLWKKHADLGFTKGGL